VRRYRSGVALAPVTGDATRFRIVSVKEASPGSEAGLERGDMLLEVDQKPCSHMSLDELRVYFRMDGRRALVVERGGKRLKLNLEMKR
jgi:C-terminal processing protease CtpA/Prc